MSVSPLPWWWRHWALIIILVPCVTSISVALVDAASGVFQAALAAAVAATGCNHA